MPISYIQTGDFVNQGRDKVNAAFGEIPVAYAVSADGILTVTKHNGQTLTVHLSEVFAQFDQITGSFLPGMATVEEPGLMLLADDEVPEHAESEERILNAAQMQRLFATLLKPSIQIATDNGEGTTRNLALQGESNNFLVDRVAGLPPALRGMYFRELTADKKTVSGIRGVIGLTVDNHFITFLSGKERHRITDSDYYIRDLPETTDNALPVVVAGVDGRLFRRAGGAVVSPPPPTPDSFTLAFQHYELVDENAPVTASFGGFDVNDCDKITGWGRNPANVNQPAVNVVYRDGVEYARVNSNVVRTDVKTALQSAGLTGVTFDAFGFVYNKPVSTRDGQPHTWDVRSIDSVAYDRTAEPVITCQSAVERRFIPPVTIIEGGLGQQVQMVEVIGGQESVYMGAMTYSLVGAPAGVSINTQGIAQAAADSVSGNAFVEVHVAIASPETVVIGQVQVINRDCEREAGTANYFLAWNITPTGGNARLFSSLDDANNTAGSHYDGTYPSSLGVFSVGIGNLAVGQKVYNGVSLSCELVSNNIYYVIPNGGENTIKKAIRVENGIIAEIKDSTYVTPFTPAAADPGFAYSDSFTAPRPDYTSVGATWALSSGSICQTDASAAEGRYVLSEVAYNANRIFAKAKIAQKGSVAGGVGVGLRYASGGGYNLLLLGDGLRFLHDGVAYGPAYAFDYEAGKEYCFDLKLTETNGQINLAGRVWKDGTTRPADFPYVWNGLPARSGRAVLVGKGGALGPVCFSEVAVYMPEAAPPPPPTTAPVIEKVAYTVNAKDGGAGNDSVGFYFKGQNLTGWRFLIEKVGGGALEEYVNVTSAATVPLTGALAEYNYRVAQAIGTRNWEAKAYACRLEASNAAATVHIDFEVLMGYSPSATTPIVVYTYYPPAP